MPPLPTTGKEARVVRRRRKAERWQGQQRQQRKEGQGDRARRFSPLRPLRLPLFRHHHDQSRGQQTVLFQDAEDVAAQLAPKFTSALDAVFTVSLTIPEVVLSQRLSDRPQRLHRKLHSGHGSGSTGGSPFSPSLCRNEA